MLNEITEYKVQKVIITYKDRLTNVINKYINKTIIIKWLQKMIIYMNN